ncbi:MAG: hypothetical protein DMF63_14625 [Acidobacteria bacterium]|nr:MAG: hypothetical protein DMF63_14625 [Acidobacteriota bacterium]
MRRLDNEKLDEIGKAVIKAGSIRVQNIDQIVAKPDLFDGVRRRISTETRGKNRATGIMRPGFAAAGTILLIAIASFAFFSLRSKPVQVAGKSDPQPVKTDEPGHFLRPDNLVVDRPSVRETAPVRSERISMPRQAERSAMRARPISARQVDDQNEFYALSYAGDPNETERGGRIVRVDISRASLFAMGFDLPLENESETVRADLLVGSDGVTRAVRVVK